MGGAVLTESVFVWPGIGRLVADAVFRRDFPVVLGPILFIGLFFVIVNTVVDLVYSLVDPRIKLALRERRARSSATGQRPTLFTGGPTAASAQRQPDGHDGGVVGRDLHNSGTARAAVGSPVAISLRAVTKAPS
jgi:hypothetical protein